MQALISVEDYLMGRDKEYPEELTGEIDLNILDLLTKVNMLLIDADKRGYPVSTLTLSSGWRPRPINERVGGSKNSAHITGQAIDIRDLDGSFGLFLVNNPQLLFEHNLYMEDPSYTATWVHLQTRETKARIFLPK